MSCSGQRILLVSTLFFFYIFLNHDIKISFRFFQKNRARFFGHGHFLHKPALKNQCFSDFELRIRYGTLRGWDFHPVRTLSFFKRQDLPLKEKTSPFR